MGVCGFMTHGKIQNESFLPFWELFIVVLGYVQASVKFNTGYSQTVNGLIFFSASVFMTP